MRRWLMAIVPFFLLFDACRNAGDVASPSQAQSIAATLAVESAADLGTLGGDLSEALAINEPGQIVGFSALAGGACGGSTPNCHAFLWEDGVMQDLGTLGGGHSVAVAINNAGKVVGFSTTATGTSCPNLPIAGCHAFLWDGSSMIDLGTLGGDFSEATAINPAGHVVGRSTTASGDVHGFYWDGVMHDLGTLGGTMSLAYDVNPAGQVAGSSTIPAGPFCGVPASDCHAYTSFHGVMTDIGTLGGDHSTALAINPAGHATGVSTTASGLAHAFLWDGKTMQDLGTLGGDESEGVAINGRGDVVGFAWTVGGPIGDPHPFLWDGTTMIDLGTLGGIDGFATDVNASGDVVGAAGTTNSCTAPGGCDAFFWSRGTILDLGTLGGPYSLANAVNNRREVVGWSKTPADAIHATRWVVKP
jgi:probable HAF family extracellular repeat protein